MLTCKLLLKSELGHLLKEIFYIRRGKSGRHLHNEVEIDIFGIEPGQELLEDCLSPLLVQTANRNNTVKPSRAKQCGIYLADIVGGADKKHPVSLILEQRDLLEKFVVMDLSILVAASRLAAISSNSSMKMTASSANLLWFTPTTLMRERRCRSAR